MAFSVTPCYLPLDQRGKLYADILALPPQESVVYLETDIWVEVEEEILVTMPNLEALYILKTVVDDGFLLPDPNGPNANTKLIPSLRRLYLEDSLWAYGEFGPLFHYVTHQTSGNHPFSLYLFGKHSHIHSGTAKEMEGLVEEFVFDRTVKCPFHECGEEEYGW